MKRLALLLLWLALTLFTLFAKAQDTLYIAFGSNIDQSEQTKSLVAGLCTYLAEELQLPVYPVMTKGAGAFVEACRTQQIDIGLVNTFGYVLAKYQLDIEPLLVVAGAGGEPIGYRSCLLAHAQSNIHAVDELAAKGSGLVFLFVNPGSTSGHLIPRLQLKRLGLEPEFVFQDIAFGGDHKSTARLIAEGKFLVGACSFTDLEAMIAAGEIDSSQVKILWKSEPIINGPVAVRASLSPAIKEKIALAFETMPEKNPALHEKVVHLWHNTQGQTVRYIRANDQLYDYIREIASSMEELALLVSLYAN
ncbi:phosphate/phosphite/phosphonate ABC transporter substrate-binding protein [Thermonema rossianum]|uniref:phosphate/phosphite/phosphonate ABC transporter substrate-binding protein n=1 Tax=Thermonema rossianum TaxID=55505 RepID=UPI00057181BA|nr:phosphate/phosphite/phosphonate ABC transporter substrate-binding protein [Thermonema rossianum]